jgi:hypothetical protein
MDIFQANTVMTDIPSDAVTPTHRAILRAMGYDLQELGGDQAGTVYISSTEPVSDLSDAMDMISDDDDADLISTSSLGIDAKTGSNIGICQVLQDILTEPAASRLDRIDIQGAFWTDRSARRIERGSILGGWAARIERGCIRVFNSTTAFNEQERDGGIEAV